MDEFYVCSCDCEVETKNLRFETMYQIKSFIIVMLKLGCQKDYYVINCITLQNCPLKVSASEIEILACKFKQGAEAFSLTGGVAKWLRWNV